VAVLDISINNVDEARSISQHRLYGTCYLEGGQFGVVAAAWLTRLAVKMVYGVTPGGVMTRVAVSAVLRAAAALVCYLPARRAARVDSMVALQSE
jgi:putative ABC transport system permease protein